MKLLGFPKDYETFNKCSYLVSFDARLPYGYYLVRQVQDSLENRKSILELYPLDVYKDGKWVGGETTKIKETPITWTVPQGFLLPFGKGTHGKDFTSYLLLPPYEKDLIKGIKSLGTFPFTEIREFFMESIREVGHFEAITEGQKLELDKSRAKIRDSTYDRVHEAKELSGFWDREVEENKSGKSDDDGKTKVE